MNNLILGAGCHYSMRSSAVVRMSIYPPRHYCAEDGEQWHPDRIHDLSFTMHFTLIDRVLQRTDTQIISLKHVSSAEEYLQDHFPTFPVLPGVMMLEAMTQAARSFLDPENTAELPWVLTQARALKYGAFVRPGASIRITMTKHKENDDGSVDFKGDVHLIEPDSDLLNPPVACSGRITLRPLSIGATV